jgi:hypothetical protein
MRHVCVEPIDEYTHQLIDPPVHRSRLVVSVNVV